jgi:hypothetical protein
MNDRSRSRMRAQLKLALLSDCGCLRTLGELEKEARSSGMTGAEIDVALGGRSFEARTAAAISYACAIKMVRPDLLSQYRSQASQLGLTSDDLNAIAEETRQILARKPI